jgi:hypothetical protein
MTKLAKFVQSQLKHDAPYAWFLRNQASTSPIFNSNHLAELDNRLESYLSCFCLSQTEQYLLLSKLSKNDWGAVYIIAVVALRSNNTTVFDDAVTALTELQQAKELSDAFSKIEYELAKPFLQKLLKHKDFDEAYYQCAPQDQQVPYLRGGEVIALYGLTPEDKTSFYLPKNKVPMQAILTNGERHNLSPVIDTLVIEPDEKRFTLVWRSRIALKRNIHEIETLIVGKPSRGWERAKMMDKLYLPLEQINAFKKEMQEQIAEEERLLLLDEKNNENLNEGNV